uniref:Transposase n=1 Tax=Ascaris lumbricoides TaxID=6252 RepID=A0A0M3I4X2_ASCLU
MQALYKCRDCARMQKKEFDDRSTRNLVHKGIKNAHQLAPKEVAGVSCQRRQLRLQAEYVNDSEVSATTERDSGPL